MVNYIVFGRLAKPAIFSLLRYSRSFRTAVVKSAYCVNNLHVFELDLEIMDDLEVKYVSIPPGVGKTRAALEKIRRHIDAGLTGQPVGYIFYVAPTVDLLEQSARNLRRSIKKARPKPGGKTGYQRRYDMIRAAYREKGARTNDVSLQINQILDGRTNDGSGVWDFNHGCVLFLTHKAFVQLRTHNKFKDTTVIFDESRKWSDMVERITMDESSIKLFDTLFSAQRLHVNGHTHNSLHVLAAKVIPPRKKLTLLKRLDGVPAFTNFMNLHASLTEEGGSPVRLRAYCTFAGSGKKRVLVKIALPSHPFVGFKAVFILSADFTTSQMYHLLKAEGTYMENVTKRFMKEFSRGGYHKARQAVEDRYEYVRIMPLLADKSVPSISRLQTGIILPRDDILELSQKLSSAGFVTDNIHEVVKKNRYPTKYGRLTPEDRKVNRIINKYGAELNPLQWQLDRIREELDRWEAKYPMKRRGVLFVNEEFRSYDYDKDRLEYLSHAAAEGRNDFQDANVVVFLAAINPAPELASLLRALLSFQGYEVEEDYVVDRAIQCLGRGNVRKHRCKRKMLAIVSSLELAQRIQARMPGALLVKSSLKRTGNYMHWNLNLAKSLATKSRQASNALSKDEINELNRLQVKVCRTKHRMDPVDLAVVQRRIQQLREKRNMSPKT